ncbi:MAG: RNA 2',3'-cyclic phosphodiesterase [Candidatus Nealsonbacteria bacterium DGGOD1a]|jgi:2'-5' RNA ligase|nr:MAG: RNA 2',3'-cyclic phosphodiesterase [Candidatus Nealsonbacteria bacterium DGGOD1a]
MNNLHRIFIAINLPDKLRNELGLFQDRWPELPARWTKMESLHITLNFLGNANDEEVCEICKNAAEIAMRHEPFDLTIDKVAYGPVGNLSKKPPKMIWAVGNSSPELGALQKDLETSLYEFCGGEYRESEIYSFAPHITLARLQLAGLAQMEPEEIPEINEKISRTFMVESIEVMESQLKKGGPAYTILESLKLGD